MTRTSLKDTLLTAIAGLAIGGGYVLWSFWDDPSDEIIGRVLEAVYRLRTSRSYSPEESEKWPSWSRDCGVNADCVVYDVGPCCRFVAVNAKFSSKIRQDFMRCSQVCAEEGRLRAKCVQSRCELEEPALSLKG